MSVISPLSSAVARALSAALEAEAMETVRVIQDEKLSGQVLNSISGRLRAGVRYAMPDPLSVVIGVDPGEVPYAAFHEYGFIGTETVRGHVRHVNYPGRSYLRSTIEERRDILRERLAAAVRSALP